MNGTYQLHLRLGIAYGINVTAVYLIKRARWKSTYILSGKFPIYAQFDFIIYVGMSDSPLALIWKYLHFQAYFSVIRLRIKIVRRV